MAFLQRMLEGLFGGRARFLAQARTAELRGELERAAALFARGGRSDEAARVRKACAIATLERGALVPLVAAGRREAADAASELELLGELGRAAEGYARAGDLDGQARVLAQAGHLERLDALLENEQVERRAELSRRTARDEFETWMVSGERRRAVALGLASFDRILQAQAQTVQAQRVSGPLVPALVRGQRWTLILGECIVIGRAVASELPGMDDDSVAAIPVPSAAVSRNHLSVVRREGRVWVRDLGGRNGTTLNGAALTGEVCVGDGIALSLGGEVPVLVRPLDGWPLAISIDIAGRRYLATLGATRLGIGDWRLERVRNSVIALGGATGAWVDLVTEDSPPAFCGNIRVARRTNLIVGDALATARGGGTALLLLGREA